MGEYVGCISTKRIRGTTKVTIPPIEFVFRSCRAHWLEIESVYPLIREQSRQRDYDEDSRGTNETGETEKLDVVGTLPAHQPSGRPNLF